MNLTPKEAAARLRVSPSLMYALLRARRLKASRVGVRGRGKWLIREEYLAAFLAVRRNHPTELSCSKPVTESPERVKV